MRGKDARDYVIDNIDGITPAHAGKRLSVLHCRLFSRDHPRTCGEKLNRLKSWQKLTGSPPHMRGKEAAAAAVEIDNGITPAHAGKRPLQLSHVLLCRDHPRTCGEKTQEVTKYKAYDILHA